MSVLNKTRAAETVSTLDIESSNRAVADVWLSLWTADALPARDKLTPFNFKAFLPSIIVFDVVPNTSVTVRLAGTRFAPILGAELTGIDWLASAPDGYRAERLRIFSTIAEGAIGVGHRRTEMSLGGDIVSEEILLPFTPCCAGAPSQVLTHINWKSEHFLQVKSVEQAAGDPLDFKIVALR